MKIKLSDIYQMTTALKKVVAQELPLKVSYKLSKLVKIVDAETELIEAERNKLVQKYGVPDTEVEDRIQVPQDKIADFMRDWQDFLATETEIDVDPISVESFGEDVKLTTQDALQLSAVLAD